MKRNYREARHVCRRREKQLGIAGDMEDTELTELRSSLKSRFLAEHDASTKHGEASKIHRHEGSYGIKTWRKKLHIGVC